jgi:hypothetical protein
MTRPGGNDPPTRRSPAELIELTRGQSAAHAWDVDDLAAMWRHQLALPLSVEVKTLHDATDFPPETTFEQLLLREENPSVDHLRAVKDYVKALERDPHQPLPREIVWLLYLVAVCAADLRCRTRISSTGAEAIKKWVDWTLAQPWIDEPTRAMLLHWDLSGG